MSRIYARDTIEDLNSFLELRIILQQSTFGPWDV
jgi:hypothetical protein